VFGSASRRNRRGLLALAAFAFLCVAVYAGWASYAMVTNESRATRWQHRSRVAEANTARLNSLLDKRTLALNTRIDQLNKAATKLKQARSDLNRSQGDVTSLELRQRELANEKAQLGDQRALLDTVASNYITCKRDLVTAFDYMQAQAETSAVVNIANASCATAEDSLKNYLASYPNG